MNRYDRGDQPTLAVELLDEEGNPVDDATLTLTIRRPTEHRDEGTVLAAGDLTHPGTGQYEHELLLDERGLWAYRWQASGGVVLAEERTIYVRPGSFQGAGNL